MTMLLLLLLLIIMSLFSEDNILSEIYLSYIWSSLSYNYAIKTYEQYLKNIHSCVIEKSRNRLPYKSVINKS